MTVTERVCACLVDGLGMLSGTIWLAGALYLQMLYDREIPVALIGGMVAIGAALWMLSSAVVFPQGPSITLAIGIAGQLLFAAVGVAVIWRAQREV